VRPTTLPGGEPSRSVGDGGVGLGDGDGDGDGDGAADGDGLGSDAGARVGVGSAVASAGSAETARGSPPGCSVCSTAAGAELYDMEQVVVRGPAHPGPVDRLGGSDDVLKELLFHGWEHELQLDFEVVEAAEPPRRRCVPSSP
jgi:hypothetical protein